MPKIFEIDGFRFFFYSNEHEPIHVHVRYAGGEAVFEVQDGVDLRDSHGIRLHDLKKAQEFAEQNRELIIRKWNEYFN
jgi:hypothetical protein